MTEEEHRGDRPCPDHVRTHIEKFGEEEARRYFGTDDLDALMAEPAAEHPEAEKIGRELEYMRSWPGTTTGSICPRWPTSTAAGKPSRSTWTPWRPDLAEAKVGEWREPAAPGDHPPGAASCTG